MSGAVLVRAERLSKKFARTLKRSMYYGLSDIARDFLGFSAHSERLRPEEFWAVRDVSFEVRRGECLGLIGQNGAGKSTILKMLNGLFSPDQGRIEIQGKTSALIELGAGFHPLLTGRENIYVNGAILGLTKKEISAHFDSIVAFSGLEKFIDSPVKFYSSGMFVRLGFAVAAHLQPEVLLLDEVLAVGDVAFQSKCFNKIGEIRRSETAVVLVSHNMHRIASFCSRVALLANGSLEFLGAPEEAIAAYHSQLMVTPSAAGLEDGSDMDSVNGSGRVRITDIKFLDQSGQGVGKIRSGAPVTVQIFYRASEGVEDPVVDMAMHDSGLGTLFQATNRDFGSGLGRLNGEGCIEIEFKSLNVNNQVVDFFFAIWNSGRTELFDWKRHLKLKVEGNPLSSGRMMFDCEWRKRDSKGPGQGIA